MEKESAAVWEDVSVLVPWDENPRQNKNAIESVAESIKRFGFGAPIVARLQDKMVIAGHTRLAAAKLLKLDRVPVRYLDLDPADAKMLALADNKVGEIADWDTETLNKVLQDLHSDGYDVQGLGWDQDELDNIIGFDGVREDEAEIDDDLFGDIETISKAGEVYNLGPHRLMCGDATSEFDVKTLIGDDVVDLYITDPPYNVAYTGKTKDALTIQNDEMGDEQFLQFLTDSFSAANAVLKEGGVFYIWHADSEALWFRMGCNNAGWKVRQCLIWAKSVMVMGRQDYQWKHEPCLYGWKDGAAHLWNSDRKQTTLLEFAKPSANREHPTMKPVDLFEYQITNSTHRDDVVFDSFGGSGTTLIASAQSQRVARLMELDPKYCDVIRRRWAKYAIANNLEIGDGIDG